MYISDHSCSIKTSLDISHIYLSYNTSYHIIYTNVYNILTLPLSI